MATITTSIDGASHDFKLLETDIPALTWAGTAYGTDYDNYSALVYATGLNLSGTGSDPIVIAGGKPQADLYHPFRIFHDLVRPTGEGDFGWVMPTGKALLARAGVLLQTAGNPWPEPVIATLTMALKGGGLGIAVAAGQAKNIARSSKSSPGKFNYTQSVLVPSILSAAAAA